MRLTESFINGKITDPVAKGTASQTPNVLLVHVARERHQIHTRYEINYVYKCILQVVP